MKGGRHVDRPARSITSASRPPESPPSEGPSQDLLKAGTAASLTDAQFKIARRYGFASWPKLKAHIDSFEEIGQLKQAIDTNDLDRVKALMTRNPSLHRAPLGYGKDGPLLGLPNAASPGSHRARRDSPWRHGCSSTGRTCTRAATGR